MTKPLLTPGAQALSVAQAQTANMNAGAQNAVTPGATQITGGVPVGSQGNFTPTPTPSTPTPSTPSTQSGRTPGSLGSFMEIAKSQGGGLKEAQEMFKKSLLAGTSQINGNNQFYRDTDGVIKAGTSPASIDIANKLNQYFNGKQIASFEGRNLPTTPTDTYAPFASVFDNKEFSMVDTFTTMKTESGIDDLEAQINELSAQEEEQLALTKKRLQVASDSPVALGVISGRQGEIERQDNERLATIQRAKNNLVNQLNTKNASIKMYMDLFKEDYSMAKERFDTAFSQNMQVQQLLRGLRADAISEADKEQDNYRAMYNTVFNGITSGGIDPSQFTPEMKAQFASLEMKAGLPAGFTEMVRNKNPKADIVQQNITEDENGNQFLNLVLRDQTTGKFTTQNISMGKASPKSGRYQYKDDGTVFDTLTGNISDMSSMESADFRPLAYKYPREASMKNNNPAGITYNETFANTLTQYGIKFEKGTARPKEEGGSYFSFPNVAEGMKAFNLLWSLPSYQNLTVGKALDRWGTGYLEGIDKTKKVSELSPEEVQQLQTAQLKKESPGFLAELQKIGEKKTPKVDPKEKESFYDDIDQKRKEMYDGTITIDQAVNYFKSKYPGASDQHIAWLKAQLAQ